MQSFQVFGRGQRQPGTYLSATAPIPASLDTIGISDTMTDAEASDPANRFNLTLYVSPSGLDGTWESVFREIWQGGVHFDRFVGQNVPNHIRMQWTDDRLRSGAWNGWVARGELDLPVRMQVGFDVVVYNAGEVPP